MHVYRVTWGLTGAVVVLDVSVPMPLNCNARDATAGAISWSWCPRLPKAVQHLNRDKGSWLSHGHNGQLRYQQRLVR